MRNKNFKAISKNMVLLVTMLTAIVVIGGVSYVALTRTGATTTIPYGGGGGNGGSSCPTIAQTVQASGIWLNYSKTPVAQNVVAGQLVSLYLPGSTSNLAYQVSTALGTTPVTISNVNCNTGYIAVSGDQSTFFANYTNLNTGTNVNTRLVMQLLPYNAPTIQVQGSSVAAYASSANVVSATAGQKLANFGLTVKAGTNWDSEGPMALFFTYNSFAISSITLPGATQIASGSIQTPTYVTTNGVYYIATTGAQNNYVVFQLPQGVNGQYSTPSGTTSGQGQGTMTPQIQLSGAYAANELIGVGVVPATDFWNPLVGAITGYNVNGQAVYIYPSNQVDIIPATYTANAIQIHWGPT